MADVFLSYKRSDRDMVVRLADALKEMKVSVWFDAVAETGGAFDKEIETEVHNARAVLVCWSHGSVDSEWVRAEALIGFEADKLAAAWLDDSRIPPPFNRVQTEDLSRWRGAPADAKWLKILDRLGKLLDRPGLADWSKLQAAPNAAGLVGWARANPADPLAEQALARAEEMEMDEARARVRAMAAGEKTAKSPKSARVVAPAAPGRSRGGAAIAALAVSLLTAAALVGGGYWLYSGTEAGSVPTLGSASGDADAIAALSDEVAALRVAVDDQNAALTAELDSLKVELSALEVSAASGADSGASQELSRRLAALESRVQTAEGRLSTVADAAKRSVDAAASAEQARQREAAQRPAFEPRVARNATGRVEIKLEGCSLNGADLECRGTFRNIGTGNADEIVHNYRSGSGSTARYGETYAINADGRKIAISDVIVPEGALAALDRGGTTRFPLAPNTSKPFTISFFGFGTRQNKIQKLEIATGVSTNRNSNADSVIFTNLPVL